MKLKLLVASAAIVIAATGIASAASVGYQQSTDLYSENTYAIDTMSNQNRGDGAWGNYTAPNGTSSFYEFNGATAENVPVFYWTADLTSGDTYTVRFGAVNNYSVSAPILQLSVGGTISQISPSGYPSIVVDQLTGNTLVGNAVTLPGPYGHDYSGVPGPWQAVDLSFTATSSGSTTLAIIDTNLAAGGNDFSIAAPEPATWIMMLFGFGGLGFAGYRGTKKSRSIVAA